MTILHRCRWQLHKSRTWQRSTLCTLTHNHYTQYHLLKNIKFHWCKYIKDHMMAEWDHEWFNAARRFFWNSTWGICCNQLIMESVLRSSYIPDSSWLWVQQQICLRIHRSISTMVVIPSLSSHCLCVYITTLCVIQGPVSWSKCKGSDSPFNSLQTSKTIKVKVHYGYA